MSDPVKPALLGMIPTMGEGGAPCWVYVRHGRLELWTDCYEAPLEQRFCLATLNREQALALGALILAAAPLLPATPVPFELLDQPD